MSARDFGLLTLFFYSCYFQQFFYPSSLLISFANADDVIRYLSFVELFFLVLLFSVCEPVEGGLKKQGRIHGCPSRVLLGRGSKK